VDPPLFELSQVCLARGGRQVLNGVTARLPAGCSAIAGPSGSGKSTLLRLLNRLADPDRGTIAYRGRSVSDYAVLALRREVCLVPQLPALLEGTVADNLAYAAQLGEGVGSSAPEKLELVGLHSKFCERDTAELSVGEQQRVMLARALAVDPAVLLLDEPTSALDDAARDAVERTLLELKSALGLSLVIVTHDADQARRLAESVLTIEGGRVAQNGRAA
jgi:putative ABC transport system ATP-binding protein